MSLENLLEKVKNKNIVIGVIGLGRVGLPLATVFATKGISVYGIDIDEKKINSIKKSKCPFFDPELQKNLENAIKLKNLNVAKHLNEIKENIDVFFITVGTPTTSSYSLDYSQVKSVLSEIAGISIKEKSRT